MTVDPIAFSVGPFTVRWYGILIASAIVIGTYLAMKESERQGWNPDDLLNVIIISIPAAFIGARLYYVAFNWDFYSRYPQEILAVWHGGLAIHGGLIGGILAAYLVSNRYGFNFGQGLDIVSPSIILGQAIGRWGNFFNQEAYGYPVNPEKIPWAMFIDGAYRHPTFLYESIWNLMVFVFLLWFRKKRNFLKTGDIFFMYVVLYSFGRFFIEGFRTDSLMLYGSLRTAQVISAFAAIIAGGILIYRHRDNKNLS